VEQEEAADGAEDLVSFSRVLAITPGRCASPWLPLTFPRSRRLPADRPGRWGRAFDRHGRAPFLLTAPGRWRSFPDRGQSRGRAFDRPGRAPSRSIALSACDTGSGASLRLAPRSQRQVDPRPTRPPPARAPVASLSISPTTRGASHRLAPWSCTVPVTRNVHPQLV